MPPANEPRASWAWASAIFLIALAANTYRIGWWMPLPDESGYADTATAWLSGNQGPEQGAYALAPMLVAIASVLQRIGVAPLASIRLVAAVFGSAIVACAYLLLRTTAGEWPARAGAVAMLALYGLRMYSRVGHRETLHLCLGLVAWYLVVVPLRGERVHVPRGHLIAAGVALGLALWAKQVAFLYAFGVAYFVIAAERQVPRVLRAFAWVLAGAAIPAAAIAARTIVAAGVTVSADMNMPTTGLISGAKFTGAAVIAMLGIPLNDHKALGLAVLIAAAGFVLYGTLSRRPVATLAATYLAPSMVFFTLLARKQDYYLLPAAIMLVLALVEATAAASPRIVRAVAGAMLVLLVLFNLPAQRDLYATRGPDDNFLVAMRSFAAGGTIASSHAELVDFINREQHVGLRVLPLFDDSTNQILSYRLNAATLADPRLDGIVLKDYYYDRLRAASPGEWDAIGRAFPVPSRADGLVVLRRTVPPH